MQRASVALLLVCASACGTAGPLRARPFALGPAQSMSVERLRGLAAASRRAGYSVGDIDEAGGHFEVALGSVPSVSARVQCYRDGWVRVETHPVRALTEGERVRLHSLALALDGALEGP